MAAADAIPTSLLARFVLGVREQVLDRPRLRAGLRFVGRPLIQLMLRRQEPPVPVVETPRWDQDAPVEPVLRLPLDYLPGELTPPPRVGVLLHAFHVDLLGEITGYLKRIPFPTDLFVSTDSEEKRVAVAAHFRNWSGGRVDVRVAPNRGRNVAPQLITFRDVYASHPFVLVLHTKTSSHTDELAGWREFLLGALMPSPLGVRGIMEAFAQLPQLGVLAPRNFAAVRRHMIWGENFAACRDLAARLGFALYPDSPLDFPSGYMFWARSAALQPLLDLELGIEEFAEEAGQKDGTLAHALERLVFHACERAGYRWARAGTDADVAAPEQLFRVSLPRELQRLVTDCGRTVLRPGRPPRPVFVPDEPPPPDEARKEAFRELCRDELDAFLESGERLVLPTSPDPEVSIVLVLFNQAELTYQCLRSLIWGMDRPAEVIIIDNASADRTGELLDRIDGAQIVRNADNLHFLRAVNQAGGLAAGRYLLLLNNDARVSPGSIAAAVVRLEQELDIGAVGGRIDLLSGALQEAGSIIWRDGACLGYGRGQDPWAPEFQFRRDVDYCSGAFLMVDRVLFEELGRFDEAFAPAYYEETDLCMRIRAAGRRIAYEPRVRLAHFEFGSSTSSEAALALQQTNHLRFRERHAAVLSAEHASSGTAPLLARMRDARPRVLIVEDQIPYPQLGAGYPRAAELLRGVAAAGAFVTLYPLVFPDVDFEAAYELVPRDVEIAAEFGRPRLVEFMRQRPGYYDAVIVSRPHNMETFRAALEQAPAFIDLDRVIYDAEAIFAMRDAARARLFGGGAGGGLEAELALADGVAAVLTVNNLDAETFREGGVATTEVLGHALEPRPTQAPFAARSDFLFVGALDEDESPNADSLAFFVREVMPILDRQIGTDYRLRVAGRCGSARVRGLAGPRVDLLGRVEDLGPLYEQSRVFIAPTRFAAGIPMKVHEAAAAGLPAAATSLLARQLGWSDGEALAVGDAADTFAAACARLYGDADLWNGVREGALARIAAECRPEVFAERIARALDRATRKG